MVRYGLIPEFIGRLPVATVLDELKREDLEAILLGTKNALVKQYGKLFALDGVKLSFTPDAVSAIAEKAIKLKTGARALRSILEHLMLDVMFELPSNSEIEEVIFSREVVEGKAKAELKLRSGEKPGKADAA